MADNPDPSPCDAEVVISLAWIAAASGEWEAWLVDESGAVSCVQNSVSDLQQFIHDAWDRCADAAADRGERFVFSLPLPADALPVDPPVASLE